MPEFIDLVPYKGNESERWKNETTISESSDEEIDEGWSFVESQAAKQTKSRTRKAK